MRRQPQQSLIQKAIVFGLLLYVVFYVQPTSEGMYWLRQFCIFLLCLSLFNGTLAFLDVVRNLLLRWYALTPSKKYGSARWAIDKDLKRSGMFKTDGLFLGTSAKSGKPLFFSGETHGLTLSPAGGGKTINFFIPALLHNSMPMIVPDLKGTLACITKRTREKLHKNKVYCVNPARLFEDKLGKPSRYNPLQILVDSWESGQHEDLITDAQSIALQLLTEPPSSGENSFFRNGGRMIIVFCILHLTSCHTKARGCSKFK